MGDVSHSTNDPAQPVYKGNTYWATQIGGSVLLALLFLGLGLFLLLAPDDVLSSTGEPAERGGGLMVALTGILFLVLFFVMLTKWRRSSKEQRAVYAWTVMQQHASRTDMHPVNPVATVNDVKILGIANSARQGRLSAEQIGALQALRPDVPYPGKMPDEE